MIMWMLGFQIITLGLVFSLWAVEMGRSSEYAFNVVQGFVFFGVAAVVSPYLFEVYYRLKNWYCTRGEVLD